MPRHHFMGALCAWLVLALFCGVALSQSEGEEMGKYKVEFLSTPTTVEAIRRGASPGAELVPMRAGDGRSYLCSLPVSKETEEPEEEVLLPLYDTKE